MNRRTFLKLAGAGSAVGVLGRAATSRRAPRVLLRSSWQTVNIGDIGHTPGVLAVQVPERRLVAGLGAGD